jgi:hypothetical protein
MWDVIYNTMVEAGVAIALYHPVPMDKVELKFKI